MVKFYDLDCSRFRKPGFDYSGVEEKVLNALAEAMKNGQNPEQVLQQLLQQSEFKEYSKELTQHYEQLRKEAENNLKKDVAVKKRELAEKTEEEKKKIQEQAEQKKKELDEQLKNVPKEFEAKQKEIKEELKKVEKSFKDKESEHAQTLEDFLQNLDKTISQGQNAEETDKEYQTPEKSKAYDAVESFYQKLEPKEAKKAEQNKVMKHALAREAEQFAQEKGKTLDEIMESPLEEDELFQRLKQLYPKYCNLLQKDKKSLGQKIKEGLSKAGQKIGDAYESAKNGAEVAGKGCLKLVQYIIVIGAIGGAIYGIGYGIKKYREERVAAQEAFEKELFAEDKGRIAWHDGSSIYVRAVQDLKTENTTKTYKPEAKNIEQILWSSDGKSVYYLEQIGSWIDKIHQIVRYDLKTGNRNTVITLEKYKDYDLDDDDIEYMQFNYMQLAKSRIEFKLGNGKWYSINEDGTQLKLEEMVSGTMQTNCPSGKHHLQITGKGYQITIYHRDTKESLWVGSGGSRAVYTPVEEKIQVEKEK